jgi:hypothetical protein
MLLALRLTAMELELMLRLDQLVQTAFRDMLLEINEKLD